MYDAVKDRCTKPPPPKKKKEIEEKAKFLSFQVPIDGVSKKAKILNGAKFQT